MTKVINLDALVKAPALSIQVGGKMHPMVTTTVRTMFENLKMIEDLGVNPSMVKEFEAGVKMIQAAFPSIKEEEIQDWTLEQVNHVVEIARGAAGEIATTDEKEATSGNVPTAS